MRSLCAFVWASLCMTSLQLERPQDTMQNALILLTATLAFLMNAVLIGSVSSVLGQINHARNTERSHRKAIAAHLKHEGIPRSLRKRIGATHRTPPALAPHALAPHATRPCACTFTVRAPSPCVRLHRAYAFARVPSLVHPPAASLRGCL